MNYRTELSIEYANQKSYLDDLFHIHPTEKNADLLDLIIKTSSNENSIVLDCFAGSGTTLKSAHTYGRQWIGID